MILCLRCTYVDVRSLFCYLLEAHYLHLLLTFIAICSKECQNNGICVSPNKCACAEGWQGLDCTEGLLITL